LPLLICTRLPDIILLDRIGILLDFKLVNELWLLEEITLDLDDIADDIVD
jgi:hypothetical protein